MTVSLSQVSSLKLTLSNDAAFNTFQGEGPRLGRLTTFLRLGGCNLACTWCDTPYTWNWKVFDPKEEMKQVTIDEAVSHLKPMVDKTGSLTISGGEPLLQYRSLEALIDRLCVESAVREVNFETNGTKKPPLWYLRGRRPINYVVSPKLQNSGDQYQELAPWVEFANYPEGAGDADFKFVVTEVKDLREVKGLVDRIRGQGGHLPDRRIWIMPEGITSSRQIELARELADPVLKRGWNLTTRLHVHLWGNIRAR